MKAASSAIDEYGHGKTSIPMIERGYTDHKVTVTYGEDSEEDGTYAYINGQKRFRLLMNFSTLSFFGKYVKKNFGLSPKLFRRGLIEAARVTN